MAKRYANSTGKTTSTKSFLDGKLHKHGNDLPRVVSNSISVGIVPVISKSVSSSFSAEGIEILEDHTTFV